MKKLNLFSALILFLFVSPSNVLTKEKDREIGENQRHSKETIENQRTSKGTRGTSKETKVEFNCQPRAKTLGIS